MNGSIIIEGGSGRDPALLEAARERILRPVHDDPDVRRSRKVLLITAAWQGEEFAEAHLKEVIHGMGVRARIPGAADDNVQNLSVYYEFRRFSELEPEAAALYHQKQQDVLRVMELYRRANRMGLQLLKQQLASVQGWYPEWSFAQLLDHSRLDSPARERMLRLGAEELRAGLERIREQDEWVLRRLDRLDADFRERADLRNNATWRRQRRLLAHRVRSAATIILYGGHLAVLLNRLHFYDLGPILRQALAAGATVAARAAGAMVLGDRVVVYHDAYQDRHHTFEVLGRGLRLLSGMLVLPQHAERIRKGSADHLAFISRRFPLGTCIGLDEGALLTVDGSDTTQAINHGPVGSAIRFGINGRERALEPGEVVPMAAAAGWGAAC
jgi:hypothetical protein